MATAVPMAADDGCQRRRGWDGDLAWSRTRWRRLQRRRTSECFRAKLRAAEDRAHLADAAALGSRGPADAYVPMGDEPFDATFVEEILDERKR